MKRVCFPGSIYFGKCPREHYIPIYLIVGGSFGILKNLSNIVQRVKGRLDDDEDNEQVTKTNPFDGTLNCFLMAWFIAGLFERYNNLQFNAMNIHCTTILRDPCSMVWQKTTFRIDENHIDECRLDECT